LVPILACVVIFWLLTGLAIEEWAAFAMLVVVASLVYATSSKAPASRASN
jgi:hypothetical protein